MQTADFDFALDPKLIAQHPAKERDASRLLVLDRASGVLTHQTFKDLATYLNPDDVVVMNDSRVFPARLRGVNSKTGGRFELLMLEEVGQNDWWVMMRPGKRAREGTKILVQGPKGARAAIEAVVVETNAEGHRRVRFEGVNNILEAASEIGEVPLPPYIHRDAGAGEKDRERYQTVYSKAPGSVAAPTAGLHFTREFMEGLKARRIPICFVTLHVGLGTFAPVKEEEISAHTMHEERFELSQETVDTIGASKAKGGRVFAVGTTTLRVLESVARDLGSLKAGRGRTRIFIYPPYEFKAVDALLTNFHLPRSTLLMLVSAFAAPGQTTGRQMILRAYAEATERRYRFFSYGDAMLIL